MSVGARYQDPILQCHTAKYKLEESQYFLKRMTDSEVWNSEILFDFYLNVFVTSSDSITEYVHADFMFHKIDNPRINWRDYQDKRRRKSIISQHPDSKAIEKFCSTYFNELDKLWRMPLVNYFRNKRNKITHMRWDASKSSTYTETQDGKRTYDSRHLEPSFIAFTPSPEIFMADMFDDYITNGQRLALLGRLDSEQAIDICNEYLEELNNFITKFDGKDFFK